MKTLYIYLVNFVIYTQISCSMSMIVTLDKNNATLTRLRGVVATAATTTTTTTLASDKDRALQVGKVGKVVRLRVVSANNDEENGKRLMDPLNNGTIVDLAKFPTNQRFSIEAVTSDTNGPIGSVSLILWRGSDTDSEPRAYQKENVAPFSLCGDKSGSFYQCSVLNPSQSQYTIAVTPYELQNLKGRAGVTRTIRFTITDKSIVPVPVPAPVPPTRIPVERPTFSATAWIQVDNDAPIDTRHEACFLMVGRKAYLLAGRSVKPVNIYDPVTRTWTSGSPPPKNIHHTQCVAVGTSIWIVSSWTGGYPLETNNDLIYIYDTKADTWSTKPGLPEERRRGSAAAVLVGRRIYVSHGNRGGHETGNHATSLGWLDYFDIDKDRWISNLPDAPNPRDHAGGGLVKGRICVAGGRDGGDVNFFAKTILPTDCYDPATNRWYVEENIPVGRGGSSYGMTCDGKLMVAGGEGGTKTSRKEAWANVDVFDGKSWTSIDNMNTPRHGAGLAVDCICNQIHIAGGATAQGGRYETTIVETLFPNGFDTRCRA